MGAAVRPSRKGDVKTCCVDGALRKSLLSSLKCEYGPYTQAPPQALSLRAAVAGRRVSPLPRASAN